MSDQKPQTEADAQKLAALREFVEKMGSLEKAKAAIEALRKAREAA